MSHWSPNCLSLPSAGVTDTQCHTCPYLFSDCFLAVCQPQCGVLRVDICPTCPAVLPGPQADPRIRNPVTGSVTCPEGPFLRSWEASILRRRWTGRRQTVSICLSPTRNLNSQWGYFDELDQDGVVNSQCHPRVTLLGKPMTSETETQSRMP